ncbi:hypothetical protein BT69DRAFT_783971 [Atractiella rhizophila]|nr:hypothetical protein BT69DRAFT_783971 [Atractiella rhizophila]
MTQNQKDLIKCSIGYLIASLFTFVPSLSSILSRPFDLEGPASNAHVVATIAVYFAPNRTGGGMAEADFYTLLAFLYAGLLTVGSMTTTVLMNLADVEWLGHLLVVVVWIGGGYGLLAWSKFVMAKPTFNTACSMVVLLTSTVITKETSIHEGVFESHPILRSAELVLIGITISNFLCYAFWPSSSVSKLQNDLNKTLDSFSTLLEMLTSTFLLSSTSYSEPQLVKAIQNHNASFTSLKASFDLARMEFFDERTQDHLESYSKIISLMSELAQHLSGLRSGCTLQKDIMDAQMKGVIGEQSEPEDSGAGMSGRSERWLSEEQKLSNEVMVFEAFRETVGPSLRRLTALSKRSLKRLQSSFLHSKRGEPALLAIRSHDKDASTEALLGSEDLGSLRTSLLECLEAYRIAHTSALTKIYRYSASERTLPPPAFLKEHPIFNSEALSEAEAESDGPHEEIFLLYFFLYTMEEFVQDLTELLTLFEGVKEQEEKAEREWMRRKEKWWFMRPFVGNLQQTKWRNLYNLFPTLLPKAKDDTPFPIIDGPALTSHKNEEEELRGWRKFKRGLWYLGYRVKQPDITYGFKTGLGALCLAIPAFIPSFRDDYVRYKGWWALVSYMVVMSPSIGQTNYLIVHRLLGSLAGAGVAIAFYELFPENPIVLPILGWLFCLPCFYYAVNYPTYAPTARFVLLTYNLTCLSTYNQRELDVSHITIALMRMMSVVIGVGWSFIITRFILPYEARKELRKGLSEWLLNAAHLYDRIVRSYSYNPAAIRPDGSKPSKSVMDGSWSLTREDTEKLKHEFDDCRKMVLHQRIQLLHLSSLLTQTINEPRLKGPFPVASYREVLSHCQNILDLFHSIQCVVSRDSWHQNVIMDFVIPVNKYRREMVGNVILFFSLLASTVWLKTPMPPYLPPCALSRQRLANKIRKLPVVRQRAVRGSPDYLLYFAYVVAMKQVIDELEDLGRSFQSLFGIIGGFKSGDMFEIMFHAEPIHDSV